MQNLQFSPAPQVQDWTSFPDEWSAIMLEGGGED
jgi:hypothetical protein